MRAAWYERNGEAAEVLRVGELPDPEPGPGEVRVRVHSSAVNPSDVKARGGSRKVIAPYVIPNSDAGGVIDKVGEGVDARRVGERVWTYNGQWKRPFGTCAQAVALPSMLVVPLAARLDFDQAACLGIPCMTAHRCLFAEGPVAGKTVLVTGGAGVVGHYAIQLAKWAGAIVVTTVSTEAKAEHARKAGADLVLDYRRDDVVARIRRELGGVDQVVDVDFGENLPLTSQVLAPYGVIASYASSRVPQPQLPYYSLHGLNPVLRPVLVYEMPDAAKAFAIADLARWVDEADPIFTIAARYPLDRIVAAHQAVERGEKIGQVIVRMD
jgi:NADPH:quinone reductase-like Zn-dependent oxidoreductase